jgi:predicted permease
VPGVLSSGMTSCAPVLGHCGDWVFTIEGHPLPPGQMMDALDRGVDPGFLAAAGVPLLRGRNFTSSDGIGFDLDHLKPGTMLISESLAKQYFAGEDPLGRYIRIGVDAERNKRSGKPIPRYQVIGVVGDVLTQLDEKIQPAFYVPLLDGHYNDIYILLHTASEPHSVMGAVRAEIHRVQPDLPLFQVQTMEEALGQSASDHRFHLLLFGSFALLAVVLAAVGLYGVLSYGVSQRRAEIGIRLALGARSSDVTLLILKQGMLPAAAGVAAGVGSALLLARVIQSLLFHVDPFDPATFFLIPAFLVAVCACACYLPAVRAARTDPTVALRTE